MAIKKFFTYPDICVVWKKVRQTKDFSFRQIRNSPKTQHAKCISFIAWVLRSSNLCQSNKFFAHISFVWWISFDRDYTPYKNISRKLRNKKSSYLTQKDITYVIYCTFIHKINFLLWKASILSKFAFMHIFVDAGL